MSYTNTYETALGRWLFLGTSPPALSPSWYVSLHSASPGETGTQQTFEATYGGYARATAPRNTATWQEVLSVVTNIVPITFPVCTAGVQVITHVGLGLNLTGAGSLVMYKALAEPWIVSPGTPPPSFAAGALSFSQD